MCLNGRSLGQSNRPLLKRFYTAMALTRLELSSVVQWLRAANVGANSAEPANSSKGTSSPAKL